MSESSGTFASELGIGTTLPALFPQRYRRRGSCYSCAVRFPPEELHTERLRLRRPRLEDAEAGFRAYASDSQVTRYLDWTAHRSPEETAAFFQQVIDAWDLQMGHRAWVVERNMDQALMGIFGTVVQAHRVETGFGLGSRFWGNGYAAEALTEVCRAAFDDPRIWRVQALCDEENTRSARVMEKAGMEFEGRLRKYAKHPNRASSPRDCLIYAIVRRD